MSTNTLQFFRKGDEIILDGKKLQFQEWITVEGQTYGVVFNEQNKREEILFGEISKAIICSQAHPSFSLGQIVWVCSHFRAGQIMEFCLGERLVKVKLLPCKKTYFFGIIKKILPEKFLFLREEYLNARKYICKN